MKSFSTSTLSILLMFAASCGELKHEQKDQIEKLIAQCKAEMEPIRVSDSTFTNEGFDLNEEFPADLLEQNLKNLHEAAEDLNAGSFMGFNKKSNTGLSEKLIRQNNLNIIKRDHITLANEIFGKHYLSILSVVKGGPIENNNEALKFTVYKQIPGDWHDLTRDYISIQDHALIEAYSPVLKAAGARDQINGNIDINNAFLDKVLAKIRD